MAIDYHNLKAWHFPEIKQTYGPREVMLYALSLGVGNDPLDPDALAFCYEGTPGGLRVLPTLAVVLGYPGFWSRDPRTGIDWVRLVHGEQRLRLHRPLAASDTVIGRNRVTHLIDKGEGRGALMVVERVLETESGERIATVQQVVFCRGDGGFSKRGQPSDEPLPELVPTPADEPPQYLDLQTTRPEAALLYRLHGDVNPLHADPAVARAAGFDRPILHGLATYALAARAVVRQCCANDPSKVITFDARFSAPVYPGETLRTEIWRDGARVQFRVRVVERDVIVLSHGRAELS